MASFVRLGMGPASDREAAFFYRASKVQAQSPGEQDRSLFLWLALQKYGVFSSASQGPCSEVVTILC